MEEENEDDADAVSVSMEISGTYESVLSRLSAEQSGPDVSEPLAHDVELVLETVHRMEEGTRSAIAEKLPEEMNVDYDAEAVVGLLQVLKRYDLVVLDGNTWKPGPKLEE